MFIKIWWSGGEQDCRRNCCKRKNSKDKVSNTKRR